MGGKTMLRENIKIIKSALIHAVDTGINWEGALRQLKEINFALDEALIIAITDVKGNITFTNRKFCEISQYSKEELIGQNHRIINSGYHSITFFRDMWKTVANGEVWRGEICNKAKDGTFYWMDTTIVPCLDNEDKPFQYVSFRNEITSRKVAEETLRRAEKASVVGHIASTIVHEIRNPLAAMKWTLQLLRMDVPDYTHEFDATLSELERVDGIVSELLKFSKLHETSFQVVHVSHILNIIVKMMSSQAKHHQINLKLTINEDVPMIRCEPNQLKQVFMNMIQNAVESMPQGGTVIINVTRSIADRLDVQIIDQGYGIPQEVIARMGEPFLTTKKEGTGLGMMESYQIVHNHNGFIDVRSRSGEGTTITISLPGIIEEVIDI